MKACRKYDGRDEDLSCMESGVSTDDAVVHQGPEVLPARGEDCAYNLLERGLGVHQSECTRPARIVASASLCRCSRRMGTIETAESKVSLVFSC